MNNKQCCAYRIYPEPTGTHYFQQDLMTEEQVERIFDYAQILELIIFEAGWVFLINRYGYPLLHEINNRSGWFDSESLDEFKLYVEAYRDDANRIKY